MTTYCEDEDYYQKTLVWELEVRVIRCNIIEHSAVFLGWSKQTTIDFIGKEELDHINKSQPAHEQHT